MILSALSLGQQSYSFYSQMDVKVNEITHSPLDRIVFEYNQHIDISSLVSIINKIKNSNEKDYLIEAVKCYNANAYRAAVVFTWIGAMENIQNRISKFPLLAINRCMLTHNPKHKDASTYDEVFEYKEKNQLIISQDLGIFDKNQASQLTDCLVFRNKCGHPSNYKPQSLKVSSFIEEIINILY